MKSVKAALGGKRPGARSPRKATRAVCPHCGSVIQAPKQVSAASLTPRQTQIIRLIAAGLTAKEIAATLGVSSRTAEFHRAALMQRLGLHTTAELTRYAVGQGLI
jgi:DNA-binding NarL/FixJ family response regulator